MCHGLWRSEDSFQSLLLTRLLGIEFISSGLLGKCFYLLSHHTGPLFYLFQLDLEFDKKELVSSSPLTLGSVGPRPGGEPIVTNTI